MHKFTITEQDGKLLLKGTPFYPPANRDYRLIGGTWDSPARQWIFDACDRQRLRTVLRIHFGHDDQPYTTVDVRVELSDCHLHPELWRFGRLIASRRHRDADVMLGPNVVLAEGEFKSQGGSMKYPALDDLTGIVLEIRDVPADHTDLSGNGITIIETDTPDPIQALIDATQDATDGPWFVTPEDLVGGWCVRTVDEPPSTGRGRTVADFMRREDALLCVAARNAYLGEPTDPGLATAATDTIGIDEDGHLYRRTRDNGTAGGVDLTEAVIADLAAEAETGYPTEQLHPRTHQLEGGNYEC